jgi:hypothetical protein
MIYRYGNLSAQGQGYAAVRRQPLPYLTMVLKNTGKADTVKSWYHVTIMEKYNIQEAGS